MKRRLWHISLLSLVFFLGNLVQASGLRPCYAMFNVFSFEEVPEQPSNEQRQKKGYEENEDTEEETEEFFPEPGTSSGVRFHSPVGEE